MGDFNRYNRPGGGRGGGGYGGRDSARSGFGGRDSGSREMHHATCAQCGKDCEVPFMPSGDRPVYCSNCFESRRSDDGNSRGSSSGRSFGRPNFEERRPYSGGADRGGSQGNISELTEQIKNLTFKVDKILRILEPKVAAPAVIEKVETEKKVKPAPAKIEVTDIVFEPKKEKSITAKKKAKEEKADSASN